MAGVVIGGIAIMWYGGTVARARAVQTTSTAVAQHESSFQLREVVVNVEGGVKFPGVYRLPEGSVMHDAILSAGGFSGDADRERIAREMNQAAPIGDHAKIYIFTNADRGITMSSATKAAQESEKQSERPSVGLINLNTATVQELDGLPGIGPAIAQRIIDWRDENGGFEVVDDLKKVKGIGDALFTGVKDQVSVQ